MRRVLGLSVLIGAIASVVTAAAPASSVLAQPLVAVHTRAGEVSGPLNGVQVRVLPFAAGHIAVYWDGNPDAAVTVGLSVDGLRFGLATAVEHDEIGEARRDGRTYGAVMAGGGATAVVVTSDRPIGRLTVLALAEGPVSVSAKVTAGAGSDPAGAATAPPQPAIVSRSEWGADESLRFDAAGNEKWAPTFWPVQKLIVHHTAGQNNDPDPKATIRSIYYYHAITQGWGDIGYNFLIDEAGNVYKGRHSHLPGTTDDTITGEDASSPGKGVTAAHALNFNAGTVGVALLGTLTNQDATPAAKNALADVLAWKAGARGIDPYGSSNYVNPVNGGQKVFPNIAGHRDVDATECPGTAFYNTLAAVRSAVAARIAGTAPDTTPPSAPSNLKASAGVGKRSVSLTWAASSDTGGSGLAGYQVYRATSAGGPFSLVTTTTSTAYADAGLTRFKTYWYYVKAYDRAGNRSANSNTVSAAAT